MKCREEGRKEGKGGLRDSVVVLRCERVIFADPPSSIDV